ncbi:MAG: hypothetical protein IJ837_04100 [Clostridia bacterium]|nr:hypothetical protein [Clostridia bacterium]
MKTDIVKLLKSFNMSKEDINTCFLVCPDLKSADYKNAFLNTELLDIYGYPEFEVGTLLLINPKILTIDPKELNKKLKSLGENVEFMIKNNPFFV